jgi:hypothetical protein
MLVSLYAKGRQHGFLNEFVREGSVEKLNPVGDFVLRKQTSKYLLDVAEVALKKLQANPGDKHALGSLEIALKQLKEAEAPAKEAPKSPVPH